MTGVPVGNITWQVKIENNMYATSAIGGASGVLSLLINGQALVATNGKIVDGHLAPTNFSSNIIDDDGKTELHVSFGDSIAKELVVQESQRKPLLTPINDADRRGVTDPLSAVLISNTVQAGIESKTCNQTNPIYCHPDRPRRHASRDTRSKCIPGRLPSRFLVALGSSEVIPGIGAPLKQRSIRQKRRNCSRPRGRACAALHSARSRGRSPGLPRGNSWSAARYRHELP
jgi:Protein of unknown function (DUF3108)